MRYFRELHVWNRAHNLVPDVRRVTGSFPREELFGITSQTRRAAASIPVNIAEGCGRGSTADPARCVQMANGSANELEYQLLLAHDLGWSPTNDSESRMSQVIEVKRMRTGLMQKLNTYARERLQPDACSL